MTVLSAQSIELRVKRTPEWEHFKNWRLDIDPWEPEAKREFGLSYGLTAAGYDIRIGGFQDDPTHQNHRSRRLERGGFMLCASLERIKVPTDLQVIVHDKSSWARQGLAIQNTVLEPGWEGYITLELSNHGTESLVFHIGQPIAQLIFHQLDQPTTKPYRGKYQNQGPEPIDAIFEEDSNAS